MKVQQMLIFHQGKSCEVQAQLINFARFTFFNHSHPSAYYVYACIVKLNFFLYLISP